MTIGILLNVNFMSQNRVVSSAMSARLHTGRLKVNLAKKPKKKGGDEKFSGYIERCATAGLCISGHRAARILIDFKS